MKSLTRKVSRCWRRHQRIQLHERKLYVAHVAARKLNELVPLVRAVARAAVARCERCPHELAQHDAQGFCSVCECGGYLDP